MAAPLFSNCSTERGKLVGIQEIHSPHELLRAFRGTYEGEKQSLKISTSQMKYRRREHNLLDFLVGSSIVDAKTTFKRYKGVLWVWKKMGSIAPVKFVLFGDSLTQMGFGGGGWVTLLANRECPEFMICLVFDAYDDL